MPGDSGDSGGDGLTLFSSAEQGGFINSFTDNSETGTRGVLTVEGVVFQASEWRVDPRLSRGIRCEW